MSTSQPKNKKTRQYKLTKLWPVLALVLLLSFGAPRPAAAINFPTIDIAAIGQAITKMFKDIGQWVKEEAREIRKDFKKESAGLAFRKGVEYFVNKIAQDTAVWIASGAKGQGPMFITQGWGEYLKDAADGAAGAILDDLTRATTYKTMAGSCECENSSTQTSYQKNASNEAECTAVTTPDEACAWTSPQTGVDQQGGILEGFNICRPDLDVQLRINLGLSPVQLGRPKCRFSKLKSNWEREISQASFLPDFQRTFNPEENDLGVALSLHTNLLAQQEQKRFEAGQARLESGGFKPVTDFVSGIIKLPGQSVKELANKPVDTTQKSLLEDTGTILGNAIGIFTNTLAQSFLNNLIKNGFSGGSSGGRRAKATAVLRSPEAQIGAEGVEAAKIRLARDVTPNFTTPGRYDILAELVNCPNPTKHGPNDCAITDNMRNAISQKMTVQEAVDKGLFNGTGPFGFTSGEPKPIEPSITDGIPFRTILLMRKYRIIPVGWELAAKYIQYFGKEQKSLNDILKAYDDNASPFLHFIDPNWVLAAPDAYCKLQGPGPEILSSQVSQGVDLNKDGKYDGPDEEPPSVQVTRNDNYCADEQTCIQKDSKGVCKFYGYCTEEKKTWNFGQNSCDPVFNTCATLANKTSGETVSYLLNTVNFDSCDEKSVGCKQYSRNKINDTTWSEANPDSINLNAKASSCDADNAGCRAYIHGSDGVLGSINLLKNPSFEQMQQNNTAIDWDPQSSVDWLADATKAFHGSNYVRFNSALGVLTTQGVNTGLLEGHSVTTSFAARGSGQKIKVQLATGSGTPLGNLVFAGGAIETTPLTGEWQRYAGTLAVPANISDTVFNIVISSITNAELDAVKLEVGDTATQFTDYGVSPQGSNSIHLKRAPDYLSCQTNVEASDTPDPNADKQECQPYARFCTAAEAGCLRYTPTLGGAPITSVRGDACPSECVGYDTYTQSKTFFESAAFQDLIPKTAKQCSAAAVGCDEFTNLDVEKQGGEAKEYYQQLRFCQKPAGGADEGVFYTWEGSDTTGFQLKVFQLKVSNQNTSAPCTNLNWQNANTASCSDPVGADNPLNNIGACTSADLGSNPDCRQFYDPNGSISYRLLSRTISISNDCRPYRKTSSIQTDCTTSSGFWDPAASACLYQAIPKEGRRCSASMAGCREFRGGTSSNYRSIFNDTFETGTGGWSGGNLSAVSSVVGGHSFMRSNFDPLGPIAYKEVPITVGSLNDAQVIIGFWARLQQDPVPPTTREVYVGVSGPAGGQLQLLVGSNTSNSSMDTPLSTEWQFFQSDPIILDTRACSDNNRRSCQIDGNCGAGNTCTARAPVLRLRIGLEGGSSDTFYIDNIELKSNINTYYLIKNSWNTPASCLVPEQMLGCQTFKDNNNQTRNVWRFGDACNEKVVGCEAVIDTQNTTKGADAPFSKTFDGSVTVDADKVDYLVNDKAKQCRAEFQGCEALGVPIRASAAGDSDTISGWEKEPTYRLNNPDKYDDTLCLAEQRACMAYTTSKNTEIYFKDPGKFTCSYLTNRPQAGWYHNVCSNPAGQFCVTATDCKDAITRVPVPGASCGPPPVNVGPNCETPAPAQPRTLVAAGVREPTDGWVGACPAEQNSCTEFIDPRSDSSRNLIYNSSFLDLDGSSEPDGWKNTSNPPFGGWAAPRAEGVFISQSGGNGLYQPVKLEGRKLYIISSEVQKDGSAQAMIGLRDCVGGNPVVTGLQSSMIDVTYKPPAGGNGVAAFIAPNPILGSFTRFSGQFYMPAAATCNVVLGTTDMLASPSLGGSGAHIFKNISLHEASVNYQFADRVDRAGCNGTVDNNTCVLFNERSVSSDRSVKMLSTSYRGVGFDADTSPELPDSKIPNSKMDTARPEFGTCQANGTCSNISSRSCTIDQDCALPFDSNALIKVTPDRQCAAWLSCRTARTITTGGVTKKVCLDVQGCEAVDDNGNCTSQVLTDVRDKDLTFKTANVDLIQNRSGYSRVGFDWGADSNGNARIIQGYMSPAFMPQIGENLPITNGDFESASKSGNPSGWFGWQNGENFRVISNPVEAQKVGVSYPREGRNFLEVNANHKLESNTNFSGYIPVASDTEYVISAYLNTLHFTGKSAEARVYEYDKDRNEINIPRLQTDDTTVNGPYYATLNLGPGFDWSLMSDYFRTVADDPATPLDEGTHFIRLQFAWDAPGTCTTGGAQCYSDASCGVGNSPCVFPSVGLWYLDDIKIQPALRYQKNEYGPTPPNFTADFPDISSYENGLWTTDYHYAPQSCRLYPEADALSCSYHDDKGLRHRGKLGYCLEWDPQNSNYCLQWWPVDSVIGEDTDEDRAGYSDRAPLYYCLNINTSGNEWINVYNESNNDNADNMGFPYNNIRLSFDTAETFVHEVSSAGCPAVENVITTRQKDGQVDFTLAVPNKLPNGLGPTNGIVDIPGACNENTGGPGCEIKIWAREMGNNEGGVNFKVSVGQQNFDGNISWQDFPEFTLAGNPCADPGYIYYDLKNLYNNKPGAHYDHLMVKNGNTNNWVLDIGDLSVRLAHGCTAIAQVVTPTGENRALSSRLAPNSSFRTPTNQFGRTEDYAPFGGAVPPEPVDQPQEWDPTGLVSSRSLPVELPITDDQFNSLTAPYQARAGTPYSCTLPSGNSNCTIVGNRKITITDDLVLNMAIPRAIDELRSLFVQSYGIWKWDEVRNKYRYDSNMGWNAPNTPATWCSPDNIRPTAGSLCGVAPQVPTITISGPQTITRTGAVTLSFTAIADADQLPITQYIVDWGDGTKTKQTALRLQSRPSQQNAITLVHTYTYAEMLRNGVKDKDGITCVSGQSCTITPRVQITDNWGWCNGNYTGPTDPSNPFKDKNGFVGTDCQTNPNAWRISGTTITVSE